MRKNKLIFVGPKQATIENNTFFDGSITLFGNSKNNNISYSEQLSFEYWNPDNNKFEAKIYSNQLNKITEQIDVMAHNPKLVSQLCDIPQNVNLICKNTDDVLNLLDDKLQTRKLFENVLPMLDYYNFLGRDINIDIFNKIGKKLVIQHPKGSGGAKTFLCDENNFNEIKKLIINSETYTISKYVEQNIPYNIHCIIGKQNYEIFAPSIQDLEITDKIEYIGSIYDIQMQQNIKLKMIESCSKICEKLKELGYLGVLGIDFICFDNELYFIEINPRFQGSTRQLDAMLKESGLPSIFEYNYTAFYGGELISSKNMQKSLYK